jgi:hypothetical protein
MRGIGRIVQFNFYLHPKGINPETCNLDDLKRYYKFTLPADALLACKCGNEIQLSGGLANSGRAPVRFSEEKWWERNRERKRSRSGKDSPKHRTPWRQYGTFGGRFEVKGKMEKCVVAEDFAEDIDDVCSGSGG